MPFDTGDVDFRMARKKAGDLSPITFDDFAQENMIASISLGGRFFPAVARDGGAFSIRVVTSIQRSSNGRQRTGWGYFELDSTGMIEASPRGLARVYNRKVRIIDIEDAVLKYENLPVNHTGAQV